MRHVSTANTGEGDGQREAASRELIDFLIAVDDSDSLPSQTGVIADDSPRKKLEGDGPKDEQAEGSHNLTIILFDSLGALDFICHISSRLIPTKF